MIARPLFNWKRQRCEPLPRRTAPSSRRKNIIFTRPIFRTKVDFQQLIQSAAMLFRNVRCLLTLAALSCAAIPSFAFELAEPAERTSCEKPFFPGRALKAGETGISLIGFLLRADGTVANWTVLGSSGSRDLDNMAGNALSKCTLSRAANANGAERWRKVSYLWFFPDDPGLQERKQLAARAASKGSASEHYQLSLLLRTTATTEAERGKALGVLYAAARLGHAHAQFDLGHRFEKGDGIEADLAEALRWYEKSAAQGDPLARQRLALDKLPN